MDPEREPRLARLDSVEPGARPFLQRLIQQVHREGPVQVLDDALSVVCLTSTEYQRVAARSQEDGAVARPPSLQSVILQLIHRGFTATEVANLLHLDLATLAEHLTEARAWYGVRSTALAVGCALAAGDIS